jgi:hypothetical protein
VTTPDPRHAERVRAIKRRRLELLEEQIARQGYEADPAQITEAEDLRGQLGLLDAAAGPTVDPDVRALLRRYDQQELTLNVVSSLVQRVTAMEQTLTAAREDERQERQKRQGIQDARQYLVYRWLIAITILTTILMLLRAADILQGWL